MEIRQTGLDDINNILELENFVWGEDSATLESFAKRISS